MLMLLLNPLAVYKMQLCLFLFLVFPAHLHDHIQSSNLCFGLCKSETDLRYIFTTLYVLYICSTYITTGSQSCVLSLHAASLTAQPTIMAAVYVPPRRRTDPPRILGASKSNAELSQNWRERVSLPPAAEPNEWRTKTFPSTFIASAQHRLRVWSKSDPQLPTTFRSGLKLSKEEIIATRKDMPGESPLAIATEAYKRADFDFRFWLFNQASQLPSLRKWHHLAHLDYEGYQKQNLTPIREIVDEMCRAGRTFSEDSITLMTKVIELREEAQDKFHAGERGTEAFDGHEFWVSELKSIRETMKGGVVERKKYLEEIKKCTDWRRH